MYDHEMMYRVLIKLWNQGDHDFVNGVYDNNKVYPLYRDVLYVEWTEEVIDGPEGPFKFKSIGRSFGTDERVFSPEDLITGAFESKYPDLKLVEFDNAGYDPETFLTDD